MRWLLPVLGALGLLGATYLGLRPRWTRPLLRLGVMVRAGHAGDEAFAAGVARAIEDRDARAGRFNVRLERQVVQSDGTPYGSWIRDVDIWVQMPETWPDAEGKPLARVAPSDEAALVLRRLREGGARRVSSPVRFVDNSNSSYAALGLRPAFQAFTGEWARDGGLELLRPEQLPAESEGAFAARVVAERPDAVLLDTWDLGPALRERGFPGPIFAPPRLESDHALSVLAPLLDDPGYRGTLRLLENPDLPAVHAVWDLPAAGTPAFYELRNRRLEPSK